MKCGIYQVQIANTTVDFNDASSWPSGGDSYSYAGFTWNGFKMLRIDPVTLVLRRYIRVTQPDRNANADTNGEEAQAQYEVEPMGATR